MSESNETDPGTRADFPGAIDDEHLILLLRDAAEVLSRAKLDGLARVIEFAAVLIFGRPAHGEPFVDDIANALDASERLFEALGDLDPDKLIELGLDGPVAETGQALTYCRSWGLDPGMRIGNAIRVIAHEVESIRKMAAGAQRDPVMHLAEQLATLGLVERKAEALLVALGVRKAGS